jgi:hypothetical protein
MATSGPWLVIVTTAREYPVDFDAAHAGQPTNGGRYRGCDSRAYGLSSPYASIHARPLPAEPARVGLPAAKPMTEAAAERAEPTVDPAEPDRPAEVQQAAQLAWCSDRPRRTGGRHRFGSKLVGTPIAARAHSGATVWPVIRLKCLVWAPCPPRSHRRFKPRGHEVRVNLVRMSGADPPTWMSAWPVSCSTTVAMPAMQLRAGG